MAHLRFKDESIQVKNINIYSSQLLKSLEIAKAPTEFSLQALTLTVFAINPFQGLQMLKLFQYFDYLRLVNVDNIPKNFEKMLEYFENNILDIVPNPFKFKEYYGSYDDSQNTLRRNLVEIEANNESFSQENSIYSNHERKEYCRMHPLLINRELDCLFLNNAGNMIFELIIYGVVKLILLIVIYGCFGKTSIKESDPKVDKIGKNKSFVLKLAIKLSSFLGFAFLWEFLFSAHLEMNLAGTINLKNLWIDDYGLFLNSFIAFLSLVAYPILIYKFFSYSLQIEKIKILILRMYGKIKKED